MNMLRGISRLLAPVLLLTVCFAVNSFSQTAQKVTRYPAEKELKDLYEKLLLASKTKDKATLDRILTETYSQVTPDARVRTKSIRIQETMSSNQQNELLVLESFEVFVYENAAVARCGVRNKGTFNGEPFDLKILSTATFVKEGGVWKIAATHLSYVKE
jgi:hypothetical protein